MIPSREERPFPLGEPAVRWFAGAPGAVWFAVQALRLAGREVLAPACHDAAVIEALLAGGARVRFYRVGERLEPDLEDLERRAGPASAAVLLTHAGGVAASPAEVRRMCRARGLRLIEDCTQAFASAARGRPLGSFGDAAIFDFTGWFGRLGPSLGGAALVLNRGGLTLVPEPPRSGRLRSAAQALRAFAGRGHARGVFDRSAAAWGMHPLASWLLGRADHPRRAERRRRAYAAWLDRLRGVAASVWGDLPAEVTPAYYGFWASSASLAERLRRRGVKAAEPFGARHPVFDGSGIDGDGRRLVALPLDGARVDAHAAVVREELGRE